MLYSGGIFTSKTFPGLGEKKKNTESLGLMVTRDGSIPASQNFHLQFGDFFHVHFDVTFMPFE